VDALRKIRSVDTAVFSRSCDCDFGGDALVNGMVICIFLMPTLLMLHGCAWPLFSINIRVSVASIRWNFFFVHLLMGGQS